MLHGLYLMALVAEAMSAALAAGRRDMDWFGVAMLGSITALGGGSCRDILLGRHPLSWVAHPSLLLLTGGAALGTVLIARHVARLHRTFLLLDAVGLVVFTLIGCDLARAMGLSVAVAVVSGMITGCFGGVLRDILCNEVPLLFRSEIYASVSLAVGMLYLGALRFGVPHDITVVAAMVAGLGLRLTAIARGWAFPVFRWRGA
ncbi:putative membrane protein YeiH [Endobacter medicaginis]|jgi:uncharacterized membrane protein YeiH|uniref:Putative membrane protein YeiH n=1 Tax=Endobacter medicaginis TaxID=1181271 RepID=A0A839V1K8_9PROT|nr:trimeric intracellular cation channel family protein [Endobacter medicaginis]MBB3174583.1 putative membrane protein YeiH [Endobacter medicaginis]MCX5474725.1 trimeric intracellular cation channel family protein [Endobacter medicaginis]NVN31846.1 trimeric intracellular cation channel family protein [Endobacter medicaginis]